MLNCTDLECILHHHHYYHHLHQLQHHLQDGHHAAIADPASENDVLQLLNSTDGELSGLSHLDAPISDSVYMICGVLIAMVLVGLIIVLLAITISKLRKREETNNNSLGHGPRPAPQLSQLAAQTASDGSKVSYAQSHPGNGVSTPATVVVTTTTISSNGTSVASTPIAVPAPASPESTASSGDSAASGDEEEKVAPLELFLWSSYPSSQQLSPYSETQDTLVRSLPCEAPQDSKGLRKNLRGKWKRLVKKKPDDSCGIPPELRDQLKQIYVY